MAQYVLYVDCDAEGEGSLVAGPSSSQVVSFPRLVTGDTPNFNIYLLKRTATYPTNNPFTILNIAALSLRVGIGPKDGVAGSTLLTQNFTWTKDAANQYFIGSLPLNTAGIGTLVGAAAQGTSYFEIEFTENGFPTTPFSKQVTIYGEVLETAAITVPAGATALTAEDAAATYLQKLNNGFIIQNATTGKKVFVYVGDDGAFHADPTS